MAAIHLASGYSCVASFWTRNLPTIARLWRSLRPDLDLIICADDAHLPNNVGLETAHAVVAEIGARLALP